MNNNYYDNCFLLLGRTDFGKSTLAKILSEDPSIQINDSLESQSKETKCYKCQINDFKFAVIDTPGYDDSKGNDQKNFKDIKKFLTSEHYKIKGIFFYSFQETRFAAFYYLDDEDELKERKENLLKSLEEEFTPFISDYQKRTRNKKT